MARTFPRPDKYDEVHSVGRELYYLRQRSKPLKRTFERGTPTCELEAQRMYVEEIQPAREAQRWSA